MDKIKYQPVVHDHEAFLKKAMKRKEFRKAYERKKKIEKIRAMKGKLKFDMTADEVRHR